MRRIGTQLRDRAALAEVAPALGVSADLPIAPLQATGAGVALVPGELVWRADIVAVEAGRLVAPLAIVSSEEAERLLRDLKANTQLPDIRFVGLGGGRNVLIYTGGWPFDLRAHDPAAAVGRSAAECVPYGAGNEVMRELIEIAAERFPAGLALWIWDGGEIPPLQRIVPTGELFGPDPLLGGIARLIGWNWQRA